MGQLPTGTVTLLLADVEGSTRLWQSHPEQMPTAIAELDHLLDELVTTHHGAQPVEQGEGDSFVVAFARPSDAIACALDLQRAPLPLIRLRIGLHTGEIQLRDEGNYVGPTINRCARIRDLGHGGQALLSGATEALALDHLPDHTWLTDLGAHPLRDLPRPERVVQLCHPDLPAEFPPLRTTKTAADQHLPVHLTTFIGRAGQIGEIQQLLGEHRLLTLTGAGGVGKTRLAIRVAADSIFDDGIYFIDLAPITHPDLLATAALRALGVTEPPGRPPIETLVRKVAGRHLLIVLDNCEHLLDASAAVVTQLLAECPRLTVLATSREPIGVAGEVIWRVPSLTVDDEAVELFTDRAQLARPEFRRSTANADTIAEICHRLDGMPLAIELAAARIRTLSLDEIADSLHDRFRLLTGGSRTAVRRQQTLRASVDWSHTLLSQAERVLFRRLAVFAGGFDLDAAQSVGSDTDIERFQILDLLGLLVDKSLVITEDTGRRTRYRMLETIRQYALERLAESGETEAIRTRHRDHYTALAATLSSATLVEEWFDHVDAQIDNLRAALTWCTDNHQPEHAITLIVSLAPLWLARGRVHECSAWLQAIVAEFEDRSSEVRPAVWASALATKCLIDTWFVLPARLDHAELALSIARDSDDPALLARALAAHACALSIDEALAGGHFATAEEAARACGDHWTLVMTLVIHAYLADLAGDPTTALSVTDEGLRIARETGNSVGARNCRTWRAYAEIMRGNCALAVSSLDAVHAEAVAVGDLTVRYVCLQVQCSGLAFLGDSARGHETARACIDAAADLGDGYADSSHDGYAYSSHAGAAYIALAEGDLAAAARHGEFSWQIAEFNPTLGGIYGYPLAEATLARGDLAAARTWCDRLLEVTAGHHRSVTLMTRARVELAAGDLERAQHDAQEALSLAARFEAYSGIPDILDCLARVAAGYDSDVEATRLLGAAHGLRDRMGQVRFKAYDADHEATSVRLRTALGEKAFEAAWTEGAALSTEEAIAYARRGRGERRRPNTGWAALTPAELDVVKLVTNGLLNKEIAAKLFISHRTVQTHLTHIYTKLGLTTRVQLVNEATRHAPQQAGVHGAPFTLKP